LEEFNNDLYNLDKHMKRIDKIIEQGHLKEGLVQYKELGEIFFERGDFPESLEIYKKITTLQPDNKEAYLTLGTLYRELGLFREAKEAIREVIRHDLKNVNALIEYGLVCLEKFEIESAIISFEKVINFEPKIVIARVKLAESYKIRRRFEDCVQQYNAAAGLYCEEGRYDLAKEMCEEVLKIDKFNTGALSLMKKLESTDFIQSHPQITEQRVKIGGRELEILPPVPERKDPVSLLDIVSPEIEMGRTTGKPPSPRPFPGARQDFAPEYTGEEISSKIPEKPGVSFVSPDFSEIPSLYGGKYKEKAAALSPVLEKPGVKESERCKKAGIIFEKEGKYSKAVAEYRKALRHSSDDPVTYELIGNLFNKIYKDNSGIKWLTKAGEIYRKRSEFREAIRVYRDILKAIPDDIGVLKKLSGIYADAGFTDKAIEISKSLLKIYIKEEVWDIVMILCERILEWDRDDSEIKRYLIEIYRKMLKEEPDNFEIKVKLNNLLIV